MLELLPWFISGLAILLAVLPLPGMAQMRMTAAIFALGAGQIYLAVLAFAVLLLIDNDWRITLRHSATALVVGVVLISAVLLLTVFQPTDLRSWSELAQLALYIVLFLLVSSRLKDGNDLILLLTASIHASLGVALLALAAMQLGWVTPPFIFIDRGSNEASVFLALLGIVPCAVMLTRTRNPLYLAAALLLVFVQYQATSRGSLAVSALVLLMAGFLWTRVLFVRAGLVVAGLVVLARNVPQVMGVFDAQLNFSARERMALLDYGAALAQDRFWTGWGWGSTSRLASAAPNTSQIYPHFHNTYVQMIVELGMLGWIVIGLAVWMALRWSMIAALQLRQPGVTALVTCATLGIATACLFDAMLFGADRSIQLIVLLAMCSRALALARENVTDHSLRARHASPAGRAELRLR